ncbi:SDR family NAD(P)-dependent oxidoreductase [Solirubrobacter soli]|uniref:SDR family NAD(P)-dependent oxidoreductase n=1 Tax=Solirubrobacter soli TaxID=363832 RepID=UPI00040592EB|nr:SDR family NAD(P)-dependent oxidoreductase [Solirubrobacter soli]
MTLEGRTAIVTGAAKGIGRGIAEALARHGADVTVSDVDGTGAEETAAAIGARAAQVDVTDAGSISALVDETIERAGRIDILVNNAGVSKSLPFVEIDEAEWDRVFDINVKGVFLVCRAVAPHMIERRAGKIINVASMVGKEAIPLFVHYSASKFAVIGITQGLAKELAAYDINVNAVCPGVVRTPLWEPLLDQLSANKGITREAAFDEFIAGVPLGRPQTPEDVGEVVAFLASDQARNMTGQGINVTGGMQLH